MKKTITTLRDRMPIRPLTLTEALRMAELQAIQLLELSEITAPPVPERIITELPRVQVERIKLAGLSGAAQWSHGRWLIILNGAEPASRQRFSLFHEFKHVLDNPFIHVLYPPTDHTTSKERAEQVCDFFAGCALIPRTWLKREWASGHQDVRQLADRFAVSQAAMRVRLLQTGLTAEAQRCDTGPRSGPYQRASDSPTHVLGAAA
ncbi:MAG: ImmA/IrrE family metallo-endopeptidase [Frankiaceae bacterium]